MTLTVRKFSKAEKIRNLVILAIVLMGIVAMTAPVHGQTFAACVDGADDVTGEPCLELDATGLMTNIFKWANVILPVLLPIAAIGIGFTFGSEILGGIKRFFTGMRI